MIQIEHQIKIIIIELEVKERINLGLYFLFYVSILVSDACYNASALTSPSVCMRAS